MVNHRPAVITRCASPANVAAAVRFGRAQGLELEMRCGGHSVLGLSVPDGGLMLDLTPMRSVRVDPDCRRAGHVGELADLGDPAQQQDRCGVVERERERLGQQRFEVPTRPGRA